METNDSENLYVIITRQSGSYKSAEICIDDISGVHWDNISGGVRRRQSGYSLYGYIPYKLAVKLEIACSGLHDYGRNEAKICIPALNSKDPLYKEGYKHLADIAGPKPKGEISYSRPKGQGPCSKKILAILNEEGEITRSELRSRLLEIGYPSSMIRNALERMKLEHRIECEPQDGRANPQKIRLASQ